jgi:hypothetical protein
MGIQRHLRHRRQIILAETRRVFPLFPILIGSGDDSASSWEEISGIFRNRICGADSLYLATAATGFLSPGIRIPRCEVAHEKSEESESRIRLPVLGASPRFAMRPAMNAEICAVVIASKCVASITGALRRRSCPGLGGRFLAVAETLRLVIFNASQRGPNTSRR